MWWIPYAAGLIAAGLIRLFGGIEAPGIETNFALINWAALGGMLSGVGAIGSLFKGGGQAKPTGAETAFMGTSIGKERLSAMTAADKSALLRMFMGQTPSAGYYDYLAGGVKTRRADPESPIARAIAGGLGGGGYMSAKENILREAKEARRRVTSTLAAKGGLGAGAFSENLQRLEGDVLSTLNIAKLGEREQMVNLALSLMGYEPPGGGAGPQLATTLGTQQRQYAVAGEEAVGGGISDLFASLIQMFGEDKKVKPTGMGTGTGAETGTRGGGIARFRA